ADVEVSRAGWAEYLRVVDLPAGLLAGVDPSAFRVVVGRLDGEAVAAGISYDHGGDCGIYNIVTREHARRRGIGTAVTAALVREAGERGCETASLQSTPIAERVYAAVGFRDLGRILEYAPRVSRAEAGVGREDGGTARQTSASSSPRGGRGASVAGRSPEPDGMGGRPPARGER